MRIENHNPLPRLQARNTLHRLQHRPNQLRRRQHKPRFGRLERVRELVRRVRRVRARVDAAGRHDALEEDGVPDAVEGVDADCFAGAQAEGAEAGGELPDYFVRLAGGDGVFGVEGVDVDLVRVSLGERGGGSLGLLGFFGG
jgi:hypothetical protein